MKKERVRGEVRIDKDVHASLVEEAERMHRSLNAHITFILEQHVERNDLKKRAVRMEKAGLPAREATRQAMEG